MQHYAEAKTDVINEIMSRALPPLLVERCSLANRCAVIVWPLRSAASGAVASQAITAAGTVGGAPG